MRFCNTRARKLSSGAVLLWIYIPAAGFTPYHDVSDPCGTFTYIGDGENAADGYRVNLGCVEGLGPARPRNQHHRRQVVTGDRRARLSPSITALTLISP